MKIVKELIQERKQAKLEKNYSKADFLEIVIALVKRKKIKRNIQKLLNINGGY